MPACRSRRGLTALAAALLCLAAADPARAQEEVPFITTPDNVTLEMLQAARVGPSDHVIDLGSGDGRIVITAARRFGASGLGVEIVPDLVEKSNRHAREAGVADRVRFLQQDLFQTDLAPATVVTMYLLPDVNLQLRPRLLALKPGTRVVSHDWDMGDWAPDRTTVVPVPDKKVGLEKSSKVHLWIVPARVEGLWCGDGPLKEFSIRLRQKYQVIEGHITRRQRERAFSGRVDGTRVHTDTYRTGSLVLEAADGLLRVVDGTGPLALTRGQAFSRASGAQCPG